MKIHATLVSAKDLRAAADRAGVTLTRFELLNSRTHAHSWDVLLSGSGRRGTQYVSRTESPAATWDEWGMFLGALFRREPTMRCGNTRRPIYADLSHFSWVTDNRYDDLTPDQQHRVHRWDTWHVNMTHAYSVKECRCGAVCRWLREGSWAEFART